MRKSGMTAINMRHALLAAVFALLPALLAAYSASGPEIKDDSGKAVRMAGINAPDLIKLGDSEITALFEKASKAGIKYARFLASFSGEGEYSLQPRPGKYNEAMMKKLDFILDAASKTGIKLTVALGDGSGKNGGKEVYASWNGGSNSDVFFKDRLSVSQYKEFIREIVTRKNTFNLSVYSADDTVFSWDICNECRNDNDPDSSIMYGWISEITAYIRTKDRKHLLTVNYDGSNAESAYMTALLSGVDYATVSENNPAEVKAAGFIKNTGKPVTAVMGAENSTAGFIEGFFKSGGTIAYMPSALLSGENGLQTVSLAVKAAAAAPAIRKLAVKAGPVKTGTDYAEFTVNAPENAEITVFYGRNEPLKDSVKAESGKAVIRGLKPGTKYHYRIMAGLENSSWVGAVESFSTPELVRLKSVPFKASSNFIRAKGASFYDGEKKYRYVGANNYYIRHRVAGQKKLVDEIFRQAALAGIKVIRIGSNGEAESMEAIDKRDLNRFFRIGPDFFNEEAYREFDYVLDSAARNNIRVIIHFTDNWEYYGGCKVYVKWAGLQNKNLFWTDEKVKEYYRQTVRSFVNRKNTVNGRLYRNDPTIFAYDLLNEPRNEDDTTGKTLALWVDEMSSYIKSLDPNHMVTTGMEGFFLRDDGTHYSGADFIQCHLPKNIDFCTYHIYPASEYNNHSPSTTEWMISNFIKKAHETIGKPVVMEEYGIPNNNPDFPKARWIDAMTSAFFKNGGDGANYWFFIDPAYHYGDGNEVDYSQTEYMNVFIKTGNELNKNGY